MKARVEVRPDTVCLALHAMYDTVHGALINRYTHTSHCSENSREGHELKSTSQESAIKHNTNKRGRKQGVEIAWSTINYSTSSYLFMRQG